MKKVEENNNNGTVILSWKLYVTPDGNEEEYYINLISLNGTKALCKSSSELKEGENVMINGQLCEKIT
ncbi:hypothetical protein B6F84_00600 [Acidianus manzaensis]|uniref:Uncharacterized protein n=2 Tax=Acidianus manzaensis TaxID=282676 RepID=A0A1W6JWQ5_9CREN|nr:hypothetical protein B6F84_00600 [Acidianus manzaensis]